VYPVLAIGVVLLGRATAIEGTTTRFWHAAVECESRAAYMIGPRPIARGGVE
jgi:hypothetical protein